MATQPAIEGTVLASSKTVLTPDNVHLFPGLTIVKTKTVVNRGLCLGLFGPGGCGKTTVAASIAASEFSKRTLHLDVEGGASSIAHLDIDTVPIAKWTDCQAVSKVFRDARADALPYDTVIWDNCSELQNVNLTSICGDRAPEIQEWGKSTADMLRFTRFWRDMARLKGLNVIFVLWEEIEKEESSSAWKRKVSFSNKLAAQWPGIVTWIGQVKTFERDPKARQLSFTPTPKTDAKFRVAPNEAAANIPLELYVPRDAPVLADILDTIRGGKKWPEARYKPPAKAST